MAKKKGNERNRFQSLIGRLGTAGFDVSAGVSVGTFQSLIGRLGTSYQRRYSSYRSKFQSLIGRLGTERLVSGVGRNEVVSIPHR